MWVFVGHRLGVPFIWVCPTLVAPVEGLNGVPSLLQHRARAAQGGKTWEVLTVYPKLAPGRYQALGKPWDTAPGLGSAV